MYLSVELGTLGVRRVRLYVSGLVQGVAFRWYMRAIATELGVNGWVRNLIDGRVEAMLEGDDMTIEKLLKWCRRGPPSARVDRVEVVEEEYRGEFDGFEIVY